MPTAIIPARLGSTRLPGKVLLSDSGRPLVQHVADAARRAPSIDRVVVAADDQRIAGALRPFGTEVVLTSPDHPNGTSRIAQAARLLGLQPDDVIVNVQGDEPEIDPGTIDAAASALRASFGPLCATVASPFLPGQDPSDPNIVKAVLALPAPAAPAARAIYFSRSLVPFNRDAAAPVAPLKHVGIYAYTRAAVERYLALPPTPLERAESLEQLRWIEHGLAVAVAIRQTAHTGIDTPQQYAAFVARTRNP
jgi:3-deoxy-manno-octulosonate cytidylyltransferase (CMP-KDO synthetase)